VATTVASTPLKNEPVQHHLVARFARLIDEAHHLEPEHRKDARHQVENQTAEEGKPDQHGQGLRPVAGG